MFTRRTLVFAPAAAMLRGQQRASAMFGDAEGYERFMGRWSRRVAPLLIDFAGLPEKGRVLDIGSGTGALAFAIAERKAGLHVTGIDVSKEFVAYASGKNRDPKRIRFEAGDAQSLRFPDAAFDACLSLLVFNFIPDAAKALREARRVTRAGGGIGAAVWDYGSGMTMLRAFWDAAVSLDPGSEKNDPEGMTLAHKGELERLWTKGGLTGVREQPLNISMPFASFTDYWDPFLTGTGPAGAYVRSLPAERVQALRKAVKQRLLVESEAAPFTLPARVWAVRGVVP